MTFYIKFVSVFFAIVLTLAFLNATDDRFSLKRVTPVQLFAEEPPSLKPSAKKLVDVQRFNQNSDYSFFETLLDPKLEKHVGLKGKVEVFFKRKTEKMKPLGGEVESPLIGSVSGLIGEEGTPKVSNVEVQNKNSDPTPASFLVQAASFKNRTHARSLVKKMRDKGYDAFLKKNETKGGRFWYRVYLGRFQEKDEALEIARKVRISELVDPIIVLR